MNPFFSAKIVLFILAVSQDFKSFLKKFILVYIFYIEVVLKFCFGLFEYFGSKKHLFSSCRSSGLCFFLFTIFTW